jgi:hypothetical protein
MAVEAIGDLSQYVEISVLQGTGGAFGDCTGFTEIQEMYAGTLDGLAASELVVGILRSSSETKSFRFDYQLTDTADAIGKTASADVVWEVRPS